MTPVGYWMRLWTLKIVVSPWLLYYKSQFDTLRLRDILEDYILFADIFVFESLRVDDVDPSVIVDAGAYSGLSTLYLSYVFPDAEIVAVEPSPSNFMLLQEHVGHIDRITCVNKALWGEKTAVTLSDRGAGEWGYSVYHDDQDGVIVDTITMNEVLDGVRASSIGLLKVDIEGSEKHVFANNTEWIGSVQCFIIETHDFLADGCEDALWGALDRSAWDVRDQGRNIYLERNR
jgi:FkbM family methyltransferase